MDKKEGYEHYFPEVPEDVTAFSKLKKKTVESIEELKNIIKENEEKSFVAWDTETTGLNYEVDRIVGFSFAFSSKEGWYVPIRHVLGNNLPVKESLDIFYEMLCSKKMCFEYNMRFDTRMMSYEGYDMTKVLYYDVQVGVYMADTNWKKTGLKGAERRWLGWGADTFEETVGEATNFAYTDPRDSGQYAAQDAIGTFAVAEKTIKYYKESKLSGRIVNELLYHLMLCEDTKLDIDVDYLEKCYSEALEHLKSLEHQIMSMVGYTFKINSNKQLGDALQSIGINTGYFTKGGSMKVDIQSLENTNLKNPHPVLGLLVEYSKLFKEINSYYEPMLKEGKKHPKQVRFNFKHCVAPCCVEGTQVLIRGRGLVGIETVSEGDYIWTQYGYKRVTMATKHLSPTTTVTFRNGKSITGTPWHPLLVNHGNYYSWKPEWVGLETLKPKDRVVFQHNEVERDIVSDEDKMRAQLYGFIDGDGCICNGDRVNLYFNSDEPEMLEFYCSLMERVAGLERHIRGDKGDNTTQVEFFSSSLNREWSQFLRCDKLNSFVKSNPALYVYYLAGMFDSDGNVSYGGKDNKCKNRVGSRQIRVKLTQTNLVEEISLLLWSLGIENTVSVCSFYDKVGHKSQKCCNVTKRIGKSKFATMIGELMVCKAKREIMWGMENMKFREYSDSVVEEVFSDIPQYVYNLEVEEVHEYIANGAVNHNTMRIAAGGDRRNPYFAPLNIMAIPKPHPKMWYVHNWNGEEIPEGDVAFLGWRFSLTDKSPWLTEGFDPVENPRYAIRPSKENRLVVGMDYCAQEIRMTANVSNAKTWVDAILSGNDIHKATAETMYGLENYDKSLRKRAKVINFLSLYGGSPYTLSERLHLPLEECEDAMAKWWKALPEIQNYQKVQLRMGKKTGTQYNIFGFPRRVGYYLNNEDAKKRAFGKRTIGNNNIQSGCASLTQASLIKVCKETYENPEWKDDCEFFTFIHDEIQSSVKSERMLEFIPICRWCMTKVFPNLPVPFETSCAIGPRLGCEFEMLYGSDGNSLVPDVEWDDKIAEEMNVSREEYESINEVSMVLTDSKYDIRNILKNVKWKGAKKEWWDSICSR